MSPPPPYSSGKPMPVWPVAAISTTTSRTRSRNAAVSRVSASVEEVGVCDQVGAHEPAHLGVPPSRRAVIAATSTSGWT